MKKGLQMNKENLPILHAKTMTAIFDCVYGVEGSLHPSTKKLMEEETFQYFIKMLSAAQAYNYRFRNEQVGELFPLFERTVGPMETNSDGTTLWLAMGLAIRETYNMRNITLENLLMLVGTRK